MSNGQPPPSPLALAVYGLRCHRQSAARLSRDRFRQAPRGVGALHKGAEDEYKKQLGGTWLQDTEILNQHPSSCVFAWASSGIVNDRASKGTQAKGTQ